MRRYVASHVPYYGVVDYYIGGPYRQRSFTKTINGA